MSQNKKQQRRQDKKSKHQKNNLIITPLSQALCPPQDPDTNSIESSQDSEDLKDQVPKSTVDLLIDLFYKIQNWFILFLRICLVFSFLQKNIRSFFSTKPKQQHVNNYNNQDTDHRMMDNDFGHNLGLQQMMMQMHAQQGQQKPNSNLKTDHYFDEDDFEDDDDEKNLFLKHQHDMVRHHLFMSNMQFPNADNSVDDLPEFPKDLLESIPPDLSQMQAGVMKQLKKQRPFMNRVNTISNQEKEPNKIDDSSNIQGSPYVKQQTIDSNLNLKMIEMNVIDSQTKQQQNIDECQYDYSSVNTLKLSNESMSKCFFELSHIIHDKTIENDEDNPHQLFLDDDYLYYVH